MQLRFSIFMVVAALFFSCKPTSRNHEPRHVPTADQLVETNRYLVDKDEERIKNYCARHGWDLSRTGTGLWYEIYDTGRGPVVQKDNTVVLDYTLGLLDGTNLYSSQTLGPKEFIVGHGGVEAGLEEAVLMLREGDRAHLILPPWLAYGVPGDHNKIPPRSVIVYDIHLLEVK